MTTTIFSARTVITMNPALPRAEAVAVRDGRIVGVGSVDELTARGAHVLDETFADHVLTPGFVEAHCHVMSGGLWEHTYLGYFGRTDPNGRYWPGCTSIDAVLERLREVEAELEPGVALLAWGLDPIYLEGERLVGKHLDSISETRQIFVLHASGHLATVNGELMRREEITASNPTPGIMLDEFGEPNGELQEPAAMSLATEAFTTMRRSFITDQAKWNYARDARNKGHTLLTDLGAMVFNERSVEGWQRVTSDADYPARIMVAGSPLGGLDGARELADLIVALRPESDERLHFGVVKLILDGSIQGFTARLEWPFYFDPPDGAPENGLWLIPPEQMPELVGVFHDAGLTVHCHCNGDQAAQVFIDAVEQCLEHHPRADHRHTVQHCQLTTPAQYRRMKALGMQANIFSNHIFFWGDQHRTLTVGPERAAGMDACATAEREGVPFSFHSDSPVTPLGHLHVMWCAVNRRTATGHHLGPEEAVSVESAMYAATLGAAVQLKMDHLVGSIEIGKYADFAVLDDDPLVVDPMTLKDIGVWGTVLGGRPQPAGA